MKLKPIREQVVVIIGASSGIGRVCALRFAKKGAALVVAARGEEGLSTLVEEIVAAGGEAVYQVCDATLPEDVAAVAKYAEARYGRIDTWVNDAAVSVYAKFWDTTPEEYLRVMEVNYLGQIHGCLSALPALRRTGAGAIIAISPVESMVSLPLHAAYSASKHAVEGAMDALRRELMADGVPISVTSVKPATINTPFFNNSRKKMDVKPKGPSPIYDPQVVADCVLYAAEHPVRDLFAGGAARMMARAQATMPGMVDLMLARAGIPASRTDVPRPGGKQGNLYEPCAGDRMNGDFTPKARRFSAYTWLETHPKVRLLAMGGVVLAGAMLAQRRGERPAETVEPVAEPALLLLSDETEVLVLETEIETEIETVIVLTERADDVSLDEPAEAWMAPIHPRQTPVDA
ncbi:SDR family oxidoreductase [Sphingomonas prati]|uniref:NAD(P)-dependent dehydrogenase (Short-subunit alcohol dehydrogenase family) n=1 Tax=Sphingomonas prati TaxID=1843237 RepID=A0A7W9BUQ3_9SPHN|nr:SDR family oxidoreductase [Sphingomonas prati]MBB5730461.1 NAD(P)-dependent dehydrogenase (short-subunit alcohol dehydrogenase family) [Sphingomonas prati]GGE94230.1 short-chain dehydrogenase [Sphingomonas prati]